MNAGERIVLIEGAIVVDALGAEYLPKGTTGIVLKKQGDMLSIETTGGTYDVPAAATKPEDIAA